MRIQYVGLGLALLGLVAAASAQAPTAPAPNASAPAGHGAMAMAMTARRPSTATTFVVQFKVKVGQDAAFEEAFRRWAAKVRAKEPGNRSYELYRNGQPQTYVVVERYKNVAAVAAHGQDMRGVMSGLRDMLDGPPTAQSLTLVSSK